MAITKIGDVPSPCLSTAEFKYVRCDSLKIARGGGPPENSEFGSARARLSPAINHNSAFCWTSRRQEPEMDSVTLSPLAGVTESLYVQRLLSQGCDGALSAFCDAAARIASTLRATSSCLPSFVSDVGTSPKEASLIPASAEINLASAGTSASI